MQAYWNINISLTVATHEHVPSIYVEGSDNEVLPYVRTCAGGDHVVSHAFFTARTEGPRRRSTALASATASAWWYVRPAASSVLIFASRGILFLLSFGRSLSRLRSTLIYIQQRIDSVRFDSLRASSSAPHIERPHASHALYILSSS
jgi:hypothetical protein